MITVQVVLDTLYFFSVFLALVCVWSAWKYRAVFPKVTKDCLTGPDGMSFDPARVVGYPALIVATYIILLVNLILGLTGKWDGMQFVTEFGGLMLVHIGQSAAVMIKSKNEPGLVSTPQAPAAAAPVVVNNTYPAAQGDDSQPAQQQ